MCHHKPITTGEFFNMPVKFKSASEIKSTYDKIEDSAALPIKFQLCYSLIRVDDFLKEFSFFGLIDT